MGALSEWMNQRRNDVFLMPVSVTTIGVFEKELIFVAIAIVSLRDIFPFILLTF